MNKPTVQKKYDSLAHYYDKRWKGYLDITHKVALELLELKPDDIILDASGGTGLLSQKILEDLGTEGGLILIDISEEMLKIARERLKNYPNVKIYRKDVHDLNFEENAFSNILSVNSLHYYKNPNRVLSNFYKSLKPNGALILVDWCRDSIHFKIYDFFVGLLKKSHVKIYSTEEVKDLLRNEQFQIERISVFSYLLWSLLGVRARKLGSKN